MKFYNKCLILWVLCIHTCINAQVADTVQLNLQQAEGLLLENNLGYLAEKLNIDIADAKLIQAKVWPNPNLSIDNFNPYVSDYQKRHAEEQASLLNKNFGKYRQLEIRLEQLIQLAGKRKKQQAIAEVSREQVTAYLADFLLNLKTEFRKQVAAYQFHQNYWAMLQEYQQSLQKIEKAFKNQYQQGNIKRAKLIRLQSASIALKSEILVEKNKLEELNKSLIITLNLPENTHLIFKDIWPDDTSIFDFQAPLDYLQQQALLKRPDIKIANNRLTLAEKELSYEKSLSVPDITFSANYDRGGGIYPDYFGIGLSFDLPFTNNNKGHIKKAEILVKQQYYKNQEHLLRVKTTVRQKYNEVLRNSEFFKKIDRNYIKDLETMMQSYTQKFAAGELNIIEFTDFLESYMVSKKNILNHKKAYFQSLEELKYATGMENIN